MFSGGREKGALGTNGLNCKNNKDATGVSFVVTYLSIQQEIDIRNYVDDEV